MLVRDLLYTIIKHALVAVKLTAVHLEHLLPDQGDPVGGGWPVDEPVEGGKVRLAVAGSF